MPLPLFWQQYAHHQDPERNLGSHPVLDVQEAHGGSVTVICRGMTASRSAESTFHVTFREHGPEDREIMVRARLRVIGSPGWIVTPNPDHGELEFCNLWPVDTYVPSGDRPKRYAYTAVRRSGRVELLPHHHLESADKHNIPLGAGDVVAWLPEDDNPAIMVQSTTPLAAGLCAYMWDMHLACKVCTAGEPVVLPAGYEAEAAFSLFAFGREEGQAWMREGVVASAPANATAPLYVRGLNTFRRTFGSDPDVLGGWPWTFETERGTAGGRVTGELDRTTGYDDTSSLVIRCEGAGTGRWVATTLGPAFGEPPFRPDRCYRLTARVRSEGATPRVTLALHRTGAPGLFDASTYEVFPASPGGSGTGGWELFTALTPVITPEPDRVHLRLACDGPGTVWFDNVLFEECDEA